MADSKDISPGKNDDLFLKCRSTLITGVLLPDKKRTDIWYDETGTIRATGPDIACIHRNEADIILDGSGFLAMPGLVNTHTHAAMTLLRGYADDMHLQQWLSEKIWPLEAHLTGEHVYWGTKLACLEMIRSGTIAFNDMYFFMKDAALAVNESGIRAVLSHGIITFGDEGKMEAELKATEDLVHHVRSLNTSRISSAIAPHAPYTVPPQHLEMCAEYSKNEKILIHTHLAETKQEVDDCQKSFGMTPAALLDKAGCLNERTVAAHGCWLSEEDCHLLGERGVCVAHNPVSNMKLATGRAMPYHWLREKGVNVCIGTDGCSSNNNLDMLEEMKIAALCQKFFWNSDTLLPAAEALSMGTSRGSAALGYHGGEIKEGMPADIVLISLSHPSMIPLHNPVSNIVYSANGSAVDTVICQGKILMYNRYIPDEEEIIAGTMKSAGDLLSRAGIVE
ncbi:MAG: amidohydrolase family protein [Methanospirillum sp.]|nr:amidohydrolase family protein [Methanospirillum sp.]